MPFARYGIEPDRWLASVVKSSEGWLRGREEGRGVSVREIGLGGSPCGAALLFFFSRFTVFSSKLLLLQVPIGTSSR